MRRSALLGGVVAAGALLASASEARADDGRAFAAGALLVAFDVASLPVDLYMFVKGQKVPEGYAMAETILGGAQVAAGGIGALVCASDSKCKNEPWLPLLVGLTAWTSVMTLHGGVSLATEKPSSPRYTGPKPASTAAFAPPGVPVTAPLGPTATVSLGSSALRFSVAPMIGDGRTTPVGVGLVGSF